MQQSNLRKVMDAAYNRALLHLENLEHTSVAATDDLAALRAKIGRPLTDEGVAPETVIDELANDVSGGLLGTAGGRFFGWVIGVVLPAALAADWLTSAWQQNAALYAC